MRMEDITIGYIKEMLREMVKEEVEKQLKLKPFPNGGNYVDIMVEDIEALTR